MFEETIDYNQCLKEHPHVIHQVLTMAYFGQSKLLELTRQTGKVVKGTGINPKTKYDHIPDNHHAVMKIGDITMYMGVEITDEDVPAEDLAEMSDFVTKLKDVYDRWPNITGDDLASLDLLNKANEM